MHNRMPWPLEAAANRLDSQLSKTNRWGAPAAANGEWIVNRTPHSRSPYIRIPKMCFHLPQTWHFQIAHEARPTEIGARQKWGRRENGRQLVDRSAARAWAIARPWWLDGRDELSQSVMC